MGTDDVPARAAQHDLVRRGYDAISHAYRSDDGRAASPSAGDVSRYAGWIAELAALLPAGATVAGLGSGAGVPAIRQLTDLGLRVAGADLSAVQPGRRGVLLRPHPRAAGRPARPIPPRIWSWLRPGGYLLAITGATRWTGTESYLGAQMFWDHADTATYLRWLGAAELAPVRHRYIPEGSAGHSLTLARGSSRCVRWRTDPEVPGRRL